MTPQDEKTAPYEANPKGRRASPPQSSLRDDSSSIEEERGARAWLRKRAKEMRREMTPHEKATWRILHEGELVALYSRRQTVFRDYILDFVSHPARLVVEIDGAQHGSPEQTEHDAQRTVMLNGQGYRVLRFWNNEAISDRDGVWRSIHQAAGETPARARMQRWREQETTRIQAANAHLTSSSMEEVAAQRPEEVRAPAVKKKSRKAIPEGARSGEER
ncbi:MAG TPA: DUF559 domain-containing protein [Vitreimonas sp.]|uniref:endonuclease domain-containing protein n=1 Tax=Vitreimonas sp. TaxID=3069702 RepID=UPI002D42C20E|nr:DUF559 domain-containing protein [Vitreimonas sp.]HYD89020.1 DUF559 domain-containing protein [Vitreimonas sp.]